MANKTIELNRSASSGTYIITPRDVDMMGSNMMDELENTGMFF